MRKFRLIFALTVSIALAGGAPIPTGPTSLTLAWDPEPGIDTFKLYASSSLQVPLASWVLLTNVPGTVVSATNSYPATNAQIVVLPGSMFYYLTASNLWGETGPSNITNTPPIPVATNLNLHR
jgi:hypothetical protein